MSKETPREGRLGYLAVGAVSRELVSAANFDMTLKKMAGR
jgi:hypothetical protein